MSDTEHLVNRLPNDIGGLEAERIQQTDHVLESWEKRCHALADMLDYHKIIGTEAKRRGVESLGAKMVSKLSYYERWIVAFANILFQKGILTPDELARKMEEVRARHAEFALSARKRNPRDGPDCVRADGSRTEKTKGLTNLQLNQRR